LRRFPASDNPPHRVDSVWRANTQKRRAPVDESRRVMMIIPSCLEIIFHFCRHALVCHSSSSLVLSCLGSKIKSPCCSLLTRSSVTNLRVWRASLLLHWCSLPAKSKVKQLELSSDFHWPPNGCLLVPHCVPLRNPAPHFAGQNFALGLKWKKLEIRIANFELGTSNLAN